MMKQRKWARESQIVRVTENLKSHIRSYLVLLLFELDIQSERLALSLDDEIYVNPCILRTRNSIGGLFWPPQIRLLTMLWSFEKDTIFTP